MPFFLMYRLICDCGDCAKVEVDPDRCPPNIIPMVAALREAAKIGWKYRGGRVGKSVVTVVCPKCRGKAMFFEGDIAPSDAVPGTLADDLAIPLDTTPDGEQLAKPGGTEK